jgi:hypothetical protein
VCHRLLVAFRGLSQVNWSRTRLRPILAPKPVRPMPDRILGDDAMDVSFSIAILQRNPYPCPLLEALSRIRALQALDCRSENVGYFKRGPVVKDRASTLHLI